MPNTQGHILNDSIYMTHSEYANPKTERQFPETGRSGEWGITDECLWDFILGDETVLELHRRGDYTTLSMY